MATGSLLATGVVVPAQAAPATALFLSFEANDPLRAGTGFGGTGAFEGGATEVKASTRLTGSSLHFTKSGQNWSGANLLLPASTPYRYADASKKIITMDYWSNDTVNTPVMMKLELAGGGSAVKTLEAKPGLNNLVFDMSTGTGWNANIEYRILAVFPNFGADDRTYTGAAKIANTGQIYEIDNVSVNGGTPSDIYVAGDGGGTPTGPTATSTVVSFESADTLGAKVVGEATPQKTEGGFGRAVTTIENSPEGGTGGKALKIVKPVGAEVWAGATILNLPSSQRITDSTHKTVTFNYFSPKADSPVRVELVPYPRALGKTVTAPQGWSRVVVDFTDVPTWSASENYISLAIFPDFNISAGAAAQSYFVDDVAINGGTTPALPGTGGGTGPSATSTVITFETGDALGAKAVGDSTPQKLEGSFGGSTTTIENAQAGGNGGKALKIVKNVGAEVYAGATILSLPSTERITNGTFKTVTFNYFSPKANSPVRVELVPFPRALGKTVTVPQGWSRVVVDFTDVPSWSATENYVSLAIFPDFNQPAGDVAQSYFVDDIGINGGITPVIVVPVDPKAATSTLLTFETGDALGAKVAGDASNAKPEGGFEGASTSITAAPSGGNGGNALKIVKNVGGQVYAGATLVKFTTPTRVTNGTFRTITFNYYSPKANSPTRIELVPYPRALGVTVNAPQGWSTVTVDFTGINGWSANEEYDSVTFFPDFNIAAGDVAQSYFIDNLAFNGAVTPAIPSNPVVRNATSTLLTFESSDVLGAKVIGDSTLQKPEGGFEGAITSIAPAPVGGNGGNALRIVKNVGAEAYAGANLIRFGDDKRVTNGTHKTISFNYFSPKANSPVRVELKAFPDSLGVTLIAPLGWSRLTADFTNVAGWSATEEYVSVAIFPDYEQLPGDVALAYFVDNLAFNGATTPAITKVKPSVRTAASIAGSSFKVGATLTAGNGAWNGTPTITYTYRWFRCTVASTKAGTAAPAASAKCATISGATRSTYKLTRTDIGRFVRVLVTATNAAGSTLSLSKTTAKKVVK
jgi:hypothetical protein